MLPLMTQIEDDGFAVLGALLRDVSGHPERPFVSSLDIEKATSLPSQRVYDATSLLKDKGSVKVLTSMAVGLEYAIQVLPQTRQAFQLMEEARRPVGSGKGGQPGSTQVATAIAKLRATRKQVEALLAGPPQSLDPVMRFGPVGSEASNLRSRLVNILSSLRSVYPERFSDYHPREIDYLGSERDNLVTLHGELVCCCELVADFSSSATGRNVLLTKEGLILDGQPFDAFMMLHQIVKAAETSIRVIDGYFSVEALAILAAKKEGVRVVVLTHECNTTLKQASAVFHSQHPELEVLVLNPLPFHDRFIFIDESALYHLGASMDAHLGRRAFMFSRVEEPDVVSSLGTRWTSAISAATKVV